MPCRAGFDGLPAGTSARVLAPRYGWARSRFASRCKILRERLSNEDLHLSIPEKLCQSLLKRFMWEVLFSIENGEIAIARGEQTHIAGCAYRALSCIGEVLCCLLSIGATSSTRRELRRKQLSFR